MAEQKNAYKKFIKALAGSFVLVLGVTCILAWWPDVVALFRGFVGIVLAIGGLLVLYSLRN